MRRRGWRSEGVRASVFREGVEGGTPREEDNPVHGGDLLPRTPQDGGWALRRMPRLAGLCHGAHWPLPVPEPETGMLRVPRSLLSRRLAGAGTSCDALCGASHSAAASHPCAFSLGRRDPGKMECHPSEERGSRIVTTSPPSSALEAHTSPAWRRTARSVMARPIPVPPLCRSRASAYR